MRKTRIRVPSLCFSLTQHMRRFFKCTHKMYIHTEIHTNVHTHTCMHLSHIEASHTRMHCSAQAYSTQSHEVKNAIQKNRHTQKDFKTANTNAPNAKTETFTPHIHFLSLSHTNTLSLWHISGLGSTLLCGLLTYAHTQSLQSITLEVRFFVQVLAT